MTTQLHRVYTPQAVDRDGVCQAQTTGAAGALTINGALASGGVSTFTRATHVSIYSSGNLASLTFTVVGTDRYGVSLTENVTGPNNNTVVTTANFKTVTRVTSSGAVGTNVEVGSADSFESEWIPMAWKSSHFLASVAVDLSSGASMIYTVQYCMDNIMDVGEQGVTQAWSTALANQASDGEMTIDYPVTALRLAISSFVSGTATLYCLQTNYG